MKIKLFLFIDFITTIIITSYVYFTNEVDVAINTGLSLFIVFSPLGLLFASPVVLQMARRVLDKEGIKINRLKALGNFSEVDTVAVPLNRFLTDGDYFVTDLVPVGLSQQALLGMAATAEQKAEHSLGRVIYKTAAGRGLKISNIASSKEVPGKGVEVVANGSTMRVGEPAWVESQGVAVGSSLLTKIDKLCVYGKTVLVLGIGRMARGIIALKDDVNFDAKEFLMLLKRNQFITVLMTAAGKKTAKSLAKNFNLDAVKTNLSPAEKAREVQILRAQGHSVAFVTNETADAPALAVADVSIFLQQQNISPLITEDESLDARAEKNLAELKAELAKTSIDDDDAQPAEEPSPTEIAEEKPVEVLADIEIPTLKKFFVIRDTVTRAAELIKTNRYITYLSWIFLIPLCLANILPNPPFKFEPLMALCGVAVCLLLITLNSMRMRKAET
ncbi:MAG: cation-translocating P-type ATPase [Selenomonadaceae bacterium]|nr:cation-translocating P-type ATPase [Selenomonadaceae bacterium]